LLSFISSLAIQLLKQYSTAHLPCQGGGGKVHFSYAKEASARDYLALPAIRFPTLFAAVPILPDLFTVWSGGNLKVWAVQRWLPCPAPGSPVPSVPSWWIRPGAVGLTLLFSTGQITSSWKPLPTLEERGAQIIGLLVVLRGKFKPKLPCTGASFERVLTRSGKGPTTWRKRGICATRQLLLQGELCNPPWIFCDDSPHCRLFDVQSVRLPLGKRPLSRYTALHSQTTEGDTV